MPAYYLDDEMLLKLRVSGQLAWQLSPELSELQKAIPNLLLTVLEELKSGCVAWMYVLKSVSTLYRSTLPLPTDITQSSESLSTMSGHTGLPLNVRYSV